MLTDSAVRSAKRAERPRKLSDSGGLYLLVAPNGGRYWRFGYRFAGKQKTLALGVYPDVGLAKSGSVTARPGGSWRTTSIRAPSGAPPARLSRKSRASGMRTGSRTVMSAMPTTC